MNRRHLSLLLLTLTLVFCFLFSCKNLIHKTQFQSYWKNSPDRVWVGPDFWANRLQDWKIENGTLICQTGSPRFPMRAVHLLSRRLSDKIADFEMSVVTGTIPMPADSLNPDAATGFLIGAGANLDYRAAALIHHSHGPGGGLFAGIDVSGHLFIRDFEKDSLIQVTNESISLPEQLRIRLAAIKSNVHFQIKIEIFDAKSQQRMSELVIKNIPPERLIGNVALISHPGTGKNGARFWFRDWKISGEKFQFYKTHLAGPIISSQYTLSKKVLKITAQLMPLGTADHREVVLQISDGEKFRSIDTAFVDPKSYTACFREDNWIDSADTPIRLVYQLKSLNNKNTQYFWDGIIRHDPIEKDSIIIAAFTGNHNVVRPIKGKWAGIDGGYFPWDWGVWFPHNDLKSRIIKHNPDLLFFSGDQVYESASPTRVDLSHPYLDYLYKWYLWCWAFRELTAEIPTVAIPDDHDVYHGNIWGAGGKATPAGRYGAAAQDAGGYKMPPDWVNMVQRTQTSNLPDPFDTTPVKQGISVYYCDLNWGGVSFAIVEDRKFKSAPKPLLPKAKVLNGWAQNPDFDPRSEADVPTASLLGKRQLLFLEHWAQDWGHQTWMKVVLSQTIFSNVATIPQDAKNGSAVARAPIPEPGEYIENQKLAADMDSDGWPPSGRNRALQIMRKCFAIHIAGDQHLGSTIQYGIDDWHDAGFALCVPSIANFWPRRWFPPFTGKNHLPGTPKYTGDFEDGFGNKMTVYAVSNPVKSGKEPALLHDLAPGYGIVKLVKHNREIIFENWPRWANPLKDKPYPGWPVHFHQTDNYRAKIFGYLPEVSLKEMKNPVVKVFKDDKLVYALRIQAERFQPFVFEPGSYRVQICQPNSDIYKYFSGLHPESKK